jgi:AraC family transcriptional regulator
MMNERLQAISLAIEYLEGHLQEPITVADLAGAAGYSLYHFIRTFNQTVQHTPYDYLMRRRLSEAARALLLNDRRVIDVAFDYQFNNHETFTRAFGRVFGMPPSHWRERNYADPRLLMPSLDRDDLEFINALDFAAPELVVLDEITLAGLMTPIGGNLEDVATLWQNFRAVLRVTSLNSGAPDFWGIRTQPQIAAGGSFYFAAVKIPAMGTTPGVFVSKTLPAGDYVSLTLKGPTPNLAAARKYLYHTFIAKLSFVPGDPLEIEHFGATCRILIPVQKMK